MKQLSEIFRTAMSILKQGSNHGCFSQTAMTLFETGMTPFETAKLCPTDVELDNLCQNSKLRGGLIKLRI